MPDAPDLSRLKAMAAELGQGENPSQDLRRLQLLVGNTPAAEAELEPPVSTLAEYMAREIPTPPVLVDPATIVRGGVTALIARAGKGKTSATLNRLIRWSAGLPWFEDLDLLRPSGPLRILVVENEGAPGMFQEVLADMLRDPPLSADEKALVMENLLIWGDGGYSGVKLDDEKSYRLLARGCEKHEPDLLFIEPLRTLWRGEENSATEMANVLDTLLRLGADYDLGALFAHHQKKGELTDGEDMSLARGSTALEGVVTVMENFKTVKGGQQREMSWSKARYRPAPAPVRLEWDHERRWYRHVPEAELDTAILGYLAAHEGEPVTIAQLGEELDESHSKVRRSLGSMEKDDRVKRGPNLATGTGSTGNTWRLIDDENEGGLEV